MENNATLLMALESCKSANPNLGFFQTSENVIELLEIAFKTNDPIKANQAADLLANGDVISLILHIETTNKSPVIVKKLFQYANDLKWEDSTANVLCNLLCNFVKKPPMESEIGEQINYYIDDRFELFTKLSTFPAIVSLYASIFDCIVKYNDCESKQGDVIDSFPILLQNSKGPQELLILELIIKHIFKDGKLKNRKSIDLELMLCKKSLESIMDDFYPLKSIIKKKALIQTIVLLLNVALKYENIEILHICNNKNLFDYIIAELELSCAENRLNATLNCLTICTKLILNTKDNAFEALYKPLSLVLPKIISAKPNSTMLLMQATKIYNHALSPSMALHYQTFFNSCLITELGLICSNTDSISHANPQLAEILYLVVKESEDAKLKLENDQIPHLNKVKILLGRQKTEEVKPLPQLDPNKLLQSILHIYEPLLLNEFIPDLN